MNPLAIPLAAPAPSAELAANSAAKRRVALQSALAAALMTALKLAAGLASGSLGVLSDAAHSGLDLAGAGLTFFSVHISDRPADEDHTYGHGKFENLSAFGEAGLMVLSCAWIIWEAIERIAERRVELRHSAWPALVLLTSIGIDFWRSRRLRAVAQRTGSPALAMDAFHFASDIWSTLAVLAGLGANWLGVHMHVAWLRYADPIAAMVVSLIILRITFTMTREAISALMDEAPADARLRMIREVEQVQGVLSVEQARLRRSGAAYFADLTIGLPRNSTFEHANELVSNATDAVHRALPQADVVIHTVPRHERAESVFDLVRAVAARNNVNVHDLGIQSLDGKLRVEQHVELDETMPLRQAHDFVTALEAEILQAAPEIDSVLTHIESEPATVEQPDKNLIEDRRMDAALRSAAAQFSEVADVHEITITRAGDHIALACHCTLPDELPMGRVHQIITELEDRFKLECPDVHRVTIHPEPITDNTR